MPRLLGSPSLGQPALPRVGHARGPPATRVGRAPFWWFFILRHAAAARPGSPRRPV